jgi:hypothetical protein
MSEQRSYFLALAVWLLFFVVAFSLGAVRELLIAPAIGEQAEGPTRSAAAAADPRERRVRPA